MPKLLQFIFLVYFSYLLAQFIFLDADVLIYVVTVIVGKIKDNFIGNIDSVSSQVAKFCVINIRINPANNNFTSISARGSGNAVVACIINHN